MFQYVYRMALFIFMVIYAAEAVSAPSSFLSSHASYNLHRALLYLCSGIAGIVFIVLIYSLVKHRQSKGRKAVHFHTYFGLELIWTTIPFLILIALAIPAIIKLMHYHG